MPNWVHTTMSVHGTPAELEEFRSKANQPIKHPVTDRVHREDGTVDIVTSMVTTTNPVMSFHNFVDPNKFTDNYVDGWYDANISAWGVKWDAVYVDVDTSQDEMTQYEFDTAWSPAQRVFEAMVSQYPNLSFTFHCVEEQGWGVVFESVDGDLEITDEWDIPESHADYLALDQTCLCERWPPDEPDYWFSDCPAKQ